MSSDLDVEALLAPLDPADPSGPNLGYDASFIAMDAAGRTRQEQEYGDTLIEGREPDWPEVRSLAGGLFKRTRDLRAAVWLARSAARREGLEGAVAGLRLVHGLLDRLWDSVHPRLDAADGDDPTERINALAPLVHYAEFLADLRASPVISGRGMKLTVRDIELVFGHARPLQNEAVPAEDGVREVLAEQARSSPGIGRMMQEGWQCARDIATLLEERTAGRTALDFTPLLALLKTLHDAAPHAPEEKADDASGLPVARDHLGNSGADASAPVKAGHVHSREDAIATLERVCHWLETQEPSHPAPLFIRRAQRLLTKSFLEIIQDLTPDAEAEIRRLAGIGSE